VSDFKNKDPFMPWNDPMFKNNPFKPWNDPIYRRDPFAPWNQTYADDYDIHEYEQLTGVRIKD